MKMLFVKLVQEMGTGVLLGCTSALCVAVVAFFWLHDPSLIKCLLGGIAGGVLCSACFGVGLPLLLRLSNRDPHVAAGPMVLAVSDLFTLLLYFSIARWVWG